MNQIANIGDFCPNEVCPDYGKLQEKQSKRNIKKNGHTAGGVQRDQWRTCQQTFTATKGTIFYRRRTATDEILETLAFLAEGVRISTLSRVKGHKADTILDWLKEAAQHVTEIEAILLTNYQLERGQLDAMWSCVGNKGEKRIIPNRKKKEELPLSPNAEAELRDYQAKLKNRAKLIFASPLILVKAPIGPTTVVHG